MRNEPHEEMLGLYNVRFTKCTDIVLLIKDKKVGEAYGTGTLPGLMISSSLL